MLRGPPLEFLASEKGRYWCGDLRQVRHERAKVGQQAIDGLHVLDALWRPFTLDEGLQLLELRMDRTGRHVISSHFEIRY